MDTKAFAVYATALKAIRAMEKLFGVEYATYCRIVRQANGTAAVWFR
jgi:hypothetical protein